MSDAPTGEPVFGLTPQEYMAELERQYVAIGVAYDRNLNADWEVGQFLARGAWPRDDVARLRSEGKSEEFIAGYLEGRK